ncbi:RNase adapter RapZ [Paenalcaligenes suwonensis]|uniref:RNase adapter RapZ n=1 Tax=Paenalcaligenes suwonensis TaxID=1202713 RepID=UPI001407D1B1|nr:RNase adapter RapZ [Paenalcaligenes suwonensis]NHC60837.1 RNase adapter RapZ [Paenalcaligenes suwonensis]
MLKVVLITGISGSGKSVALRLLEDTGYTCVDNLPVPFLQEFITRSVETQLDRVAIAIDVRAPGDLNSLPGILTQLRNSGVAVRVIFLDANDHTLKQRYSESRRRHPLTDRLRQDNQAPSLQACIDAERQMMAALREQEHVIDTSDLAPGQLRAWVRDLVQADRAPVVLTFESFAYKRGVPGDADLVFDVRCLPNPHYDAELRHLTGRDEPVAQWLDRFGSVQNMVDDIAGFVERWLPLYMQDTRNYLTVAIGCTGGQHRSVYVVEQLARRFSHHSPLLVRHRNQPPINPVP